MHPTEFLQLNLLPFIGKGRLCVENVVNIDITHNPPYQEGFFVYITMKNHESHRKQRSYTTVEQTYATECTKPSYILIQNGFYTYDRIKPDVPYSLIGRKSGSTWDCTIIFETLDAEDVSLVGVDVDDQYWRNVDLVPGLPAIIKQYIDPLYEPDANLLKQVESIWRRSLQSGQPFADMLFQDVVQV